MISREDILDVTLRFCMLIKKMPGMAVADIIWRDDFSRKMSIFDVEDFISDYREHISGVQTLRGIDSNFARVLFVCSELEKLVPSSIEELEFCRPSETEILASLNRILIADGG